MFCVILSPVLLPKKFHDSRMYDIWFGSVSPKIKLRRQTLGVLYHCSHVQGTFMCARRSYNRRSCAVVQDAILARNAGSEFPVLLHTGCPQIMKTVIRQEITLRNEHSPLDEPACTDATKILKCTFGLKCSPFFGYFVNTVTKFVIQY
jgi:hypothetical protein